MGRPWIKTVEITNFKGESVPVNATDVDGFLAAYATDDNIFWRADTGHIQNVLDELIVRLSFKEQQLKSANETITALASELRAARSESPGSSDATS
jgi:hypothetical protein